MFISRLLIHSDVSSSLCFRSYWCQLWIMKDLPKRDNYYRQGILLHCEMLSLTQICQLKLLSQTAILWSTIWANLGGKCFTSFFAIWIKIEYDSGHFKVSCSTVSSVMDFCSLTEGCLVVCFSSRLTTGVQRCQGFFGKIWKAVGPRWPCHSWGGGWSSRGGGSPPLRQKFALIHYKIGHFLVTGMNLLNCEVLWWLD